MINATTTATTKMKNLNNQIWQLNHGQLVIARGLIRMSFAGCYAGSGGYHGDEELCNALHIKNIKNEISILREDNEGAAAFDIEKVCAFVLARI